MWIDRKVIDCVFFKFEWYSNIQSNYGTNSDTAHFCHIAHCFIKSFKSSWHQEVLKAAALSSSFLCAFLPISCHLSSSIDFCPPSIPPSVLLTLLLLSSSLWEIREDLSPHWAHFTTPGREETSTISLGTKERNNFKFKSHYKTHKQPSHHVKYCLFITYHCPCGLKCRVEL